MRTLLTFTFVLFVLHSTSAHYLNIIHQTITHPETNISSASLYDNNFHFFQNRWKPNQHIHVEFGKVEAGKIENGWWSAQWLIEDAGNGYVRIKNRWKNTYLNNETGKLAIGKIESGWWSAQWIIENAGDGYVRFKNRWKGTYLHNQYGNLQLGTIESGWWSAQWRIN